MITIVAAAIGGFTLGSLSVSLLNTLRRGQCAPCPGPEEHELSSIDRGVISNEFAVRAAAVRRELGRYADELAAGDDLLREQLRTFEVGA